MKASLMKYKLLLVGDDHVLFEVPLSSVDWPRGELENEFKAAENDFERLSEIFDALSHETRLRMMTRVLEDENHTMSFADFMKDLDLNPKIVWENSKKLEQGGFLEKTGRGQYSCSSFGQKAFIMMSLALHRLIVSLDEIEEV
jgi:DNA-binding transcriptional regulator YhcF (GntR family)